MFIDGSFQYFDYGSKTNREKYGQDTPPQYNLTKINTPFALFYAQNDWLAGPEVSLSINACFQWLKRKIFIVLQDVSKLFEQMHRTSIGMFKVPFESFNHLDFLWGKDAPTLVYAKLLEVMGRFLRK